MRERIGDDTYPILGVARTKRAWLSIMGPKILLVLLTYYDMA
jgi:hypothetical protein